jgi:hypothetical protein
VLAVSAEIDGDRVAAAVGEASLWRVDVAGPHNDVMRSARDLAGFRGVARSVLAAIGRTHGAAAPVAVFPALPASAAVELGRVRMPKADPPLTIYDQNGRRGGFAPAFTIGGSDGPRNSSEDGQL